MGKTEGTNLPPGTLAPLSSPGGSGPGITTGSSSPSINGPAPGSTTAAPQISVTDAFATSGIMETAITADGTPLQYSKTSFADLSTLTEFSTVTTPIPFTNEDGSSFTIPAAVVIVGPGGSWWNGGPGGFGLSGPSCIWPFCPPGGGGNVGGGSGGPPGAPAPPSAPNKPGKSRNDGPDNGGSKDDNPDNDDSKDDNPGDNNYSDEDKNSDDNLEDNPDAKPADNPEEDKPDDENDEEEQSTKSQEQPSTQSSPTNLLCLSKPNVTFISWRKLGQRLKYPAVVLSVEVTDKPTPQIFGTASADLDWDEPLNVDTKIDQLSVTPQPGGLHDKRGALRGRAVPQVKPHVILKNGPISFSVGSLEWDSTSSQCSVGDWDNGDANDFFEDLAFGDTVTPVHQADCEFDRSIPNEKKRTLAIPFGDADHQSWGPVAKTPSWTRDRFPSPIEENLLQIRAPEHSAAWKTYAPKGVRYYQEWKDKTGKDWVEPARQIRDTMTKEGLSIERSYYAIIVTSPEQEAIADFSNTISGTARVFLANSNDRGGRPAKSTDASKAPDERYLPELQRYPIARFHSSLVPPLLSGSLEATILIALSSGHRSSQNPPRVSCSTDLSSPAINPAYLTRGPSLHVNLTPASSHPAATIITTSPEPRKDAPETPIADIPVGTPPWKPGPIATV
ncbi:MAG: hypothetical protein Q9215_005800 [Flavoplaca cf. flavocitrina]